MYRVYGRGKLINDCHVQIAAFLSVKRRSVPGYSSRPEPFSVFFAGPVFLELKSPEIGAGLVFALILVCLAGF